MSESGFERSRPVAALPDIAAAFFRDGNAWFRLNPEWEVLSFCGRVLKVRYERSEAEAEWRVTMADFSESGGRVLLEGEQPRHIDLGWQRQANGSTSLVYREEFPASVETARRAELNLWLEAAAGYLALAARSDWRARLGKWLLDKAWLKMSPTARRVGLIIIAMEALALLLFVAAVIVYKIAG